MDITPTTAEMVAATSGSNLVSPTIPEVKSAAPAVVTSAPAVSELQQAQSTVKTVTQDIQNQQQNKSVADAQAKEEAQKQAEAKSNTDLAAAASNLAPTNNYVDNGGNLNAAGQQALAQLGAANGTNYYVLNGNIIDQTTGKAVGTVQDLQSGKITNATKFGTGTTDLNTGTTTQSDIDAQRKEAADNTTKLETAYNDFKNSIAGIQNGTIPLSADQQAQIDATKAIFEQARQAQLIANQNFTAGTTQAGIVRGLQRYSPLIALGEIQASINAGIQQITKIDADMTKAVSDLRLSFVTQNLKLAKDAYDEYKDLVTAKNDEINKLADAAQQHLDKVVDQNQKQQEIDAKAKQDAFDNKMKSDQFTLDEKKEAWKEIMDDKNFTEEQKKNATDKWYKEQDIAIKKAGQILSDNTAAQSWVTNIINGTAKLSDVPKNLKDAVSLGLANAAPNKQSEILKTTQESLQSLQDMVDQNKGFTGAVGFKGIIGTPLGPIAGTASANFAAKAGQAINDVVLPNLNLLKGLGRVTQTEFNTLKDALTGLSINTDRTSRYYGTSTLSEDQFKKELKIVLDKINEKVSDENNGGATEHNGIKLPTSNQTSGGSVYNGVTLPN